MIRRIRLRNWRSYSDATIDLDHRVVFFVAPNGVGKTSVYEAARRCLLGFPKTNAGRAVRAGAKRAELSMELSVGDSNVTVTRTLTPTGRATFTAEEDGGSLGEAAFMARLQHAWAADPTLLDRLVFGDSDLRGATSTKPLPVREHLAELLGVTPLLEAARVLRKAGTDAASSVTAIRGEVASTAAAVRKEQAALESSEQVQNELLQERRDVRERIATAEAGVRTADAWEAYRNALTVYNNEVSLLLSEVGELITIDPEDPTAGLETARLDAERDLAHAREAAANSVRNAALATTASDLLAEAPSVCPTCLRPLSDKERAAALHAHGETANTAGTERKRAAAASTIAEQHLRAIGEFTRRLDRLQRPSPPPEEDPGPAPAAQLAELRVLESDLAERIGEVRGRLAAAIAVLQDAQREAETTARLQRAASEELLLSTTAGILEAVADRYLSERIEPLQLDIEHRWKLVFGTEGLLLDPSGNIRLRRGGVDLGTEDMSGGERAVAGVIIRLLVAAAATHIPTMWFDEPLEHLDPRRRVGIAQSLILAVAANTIDQIVATTYEEGIARRLELAAPDLVAVVYADDRHTEREVPAR